jgi:hypothetical protein
LGFRSAGEDCAETLRPEDAAFVTKAALLITSDKRMKLEIPKAMICLGSRSRFLEDSRCFGCTRTLSKPKGFFLIENVMVKPAWTRWIRFDYMDLRY